MAQQAPDYRPGGRGMQAPLGYQPPNPQRQTQANNGGPMGLGQPRKNLKTAINPQGGPTPAPAGPPPPGQGNPQALYPEPVDPIANTERDLWANRNSREPIQLIEQAFTAFLQRLPQPHETQALLSQAQSTDALVHQLLALKPQTHTPVRPAILGL